MAGAGVLLIGAAAALSGFAVNLANSRDLPTGRIPWSSGSMEASHLRLSFREQQGRSDRRLAERALAAAPSTPLGYEPYLYVGAERVLAGDARGEALVREAIRRNPRSTHARGLLLRYYAQTGNLPRAIAEVAGLVRLSPDEASELVFAIGSQMRTPAMIDDAVNALRGTPRLYPSLVNGFVRQQPNAALVAALRDRLPPRAVASQDVSRPLVDALVGTGDYRGARRIWARSFGTNGQAALLYDSAFRDGRAPPPFNWSLTQSDLGVAERQRGGGVYIEYFGREAGTLAQQITVLPPGKYRLAARLLPGESLAEKLFVRVSCARTDSLLELAELRPAIDRETVVAVDFAVTPACDAQKVEIIGRPGAAPGSATVVVRNMGLERVGG